MSDKTDKKRTSILNVLRGQSGPLPSAAITRMLQAAGHDVSDRTVRLYLKEMEEEGLILSHGRRGRQISDAGLDELRATQVYQRVGYLSAKIDQMTYRMNFDLQTRSGELVVNMSVLDPRRMVEWVEHICRVFTDGYAMGNLCALVGPGETVGDIMVPPGHVGFCTVCSITLNGVLLKHGVPMSSRFGGLLEVRNSKPTRFVEMIHYDGTSIDPLEVFIRSGMTDYHGAIRDGCGRIGASFRELPDDSRDLVLHLADRLKAIGLGGFMDIGLPGQPLLGVPVSEGRIGAIVIGGLNPIAILEEVGTRVQSRALSGLMEYNRLFPSEELPKRLHEFLK